MRTSKGHEVHVIEGDAAGIQDRGREIVDLGEQMIGAADLLREIGDGATEERGRSIERIRTEVGDVHEELRLAGERYKPSGAAMRDYGSALATIQAAMRTIVQEAEDAQTKLDGKRGAAETARTDAQAPQDPGTDVTAVNEAVTEAENEVAAAESELAGVHTRFDTQWDAWDAAYDDALRGINDATEGNISDDWTDDLAGVVEVVVKVLSWVGLALVVLALIVGGPIIALIAAVVGLLALIGTAFLYAKGRKTLGDLIWAVVGVLPFGKLGKLFQSGKRMTGLKEFAKGPFGEIATHGRRAGALIGLPFRAGGPATAAGLGFFSRMGYRWNLFTRFSNFGGAGFRSIPSRIWGGSSRGYAVAFAQSVQNFPAKYSGALSAQIGSGPLAEVLSSGSNPVHVAEGIANVGEFLLKRPRGLMTSGQQAYAAAFGTDPVDTWREQLHR